MADAKITDLAALAVADAADVLLVIDTSDTSASAAGTDKKLTIAVLKTAIGSLLTPADIQAVALTALGAVNGVATLDATGKLTPSQLPAVTITDTYVVASQAEMLALDVTRGTVAVRTDVNKTFILKGDDPSVLGNWQELATPTAGVVSVNGQNNVVVLSAADVGALAATMRGTANGVASLDAGGKIPSAQLPSTAVGIPTSEKGTANGVATLDGDGKVPVAQLPASVAGAVRSINTKTPNGGGAVTLSPADIGAQDALVSGTNIKTVNGQNLLGSGDIAISGGGGGGGGFNVQTQTVTAGQIFSYALPVDQTTYGFDSYALKSEAGAQNQTVGYDTYVSGSAADYDQTSDVYFDGSAKVYTGGPLSLTADAGFYSAAMRITGNSVRVAMDGAFAFPVMTANNVPAGYTASVSSTFTGIERPAYVVFDHAPGDASTGCWFSGQGLLPAWARIDGPAPVTVVSYGLAPRSDTTGDVPTAWILQGSNDGSSWSDLDTRTGVSWGSTAEKTFTVTTPGAYSKYRIYITAGVTNYVSLSMLNLYSNDKLLLRGGDGTYYTAAAGVLTATTTPANANDFATFGFTDSGTILPAQLAGKGAVRVVAANSVPVTQTYQPKAQIAVPKAAKLISGAMWQEVNSATASASGTGKVRLAVSRDRTTWYTYTGGAWASLGALTIDDAGAATLIASGNTPAQINALTATEWNAFFAAAPGGLPDALAFAFALDVPAATTDVAQLGDLSLSVDFIPAWKKQTAAEVEIRWYRNSVSFKAIAAGDYKFAYQSPTP